MGNLDSIYIDPTLEAMHRAVEAKSEREPRRSYLGASSVGSECERKVWYNYTGAPSEPRKAPLIYAAEDGHTVEDVVAARLRMIPGIELWTHKDDGKQWGFSDFDGRFKGHCDGVILGLLQAPATPSVWENKSKNQKSFDEFKKIRDEKGEKETLKAYDFQYYVQAQLLMGYMKLTRHYLTVCTPGARDITSCRTEFDKEFFKAQVDKAKRILEAREPPERAYNSKSFYKCKWCEFRETCWK